MNKALLLGIGGVVVVGGIAWTVMSGGDESDLSGGTTLAGQEETTLRSLLGRESQKCIYALPNSPADQTATAYIAGGRIRLEAVEGAHSLLSDDIVYIWRDGESVGIKIEPTAEAASTDGDSFDDRVKVSCENWRADMSLFEIPKDVTFRDLSSLVPGGNTSGSSGASSQCGMCASLPADQQAACKQALNCK
ncbi:MAG: hypothetical protein QY311_00570 [Candidatus Paceibacterota bacterium]|nr:MAG: hypothetical protein QY311_00570 [Candidatus Paceibacterota bacterium]